MVKFDVLMSIKDVQKFSEVIFDILRYKENPEQLTEFLAEPLTEKQLQTVKSVAESGNYPLSLDGLQ